jgi:membrane protein implicated in regulation of membrane protease activity
MIKILEIAWLVITIITFVVAAVQLVEDGIQSALWMFIVSSVAFAMFLIRRKQRIRMDRQEENQQDETTRYH